MKNIAFIDGQNLHMGTTSEGWKVDFKKFKVYLKENYDIDSAYYFLGYFSVKYQKLYENLLESGFIVVFKEHSENLKTSKKGNIDGDLIFEAMRFLLENKDFGKVLIISGDGDYKKIVNYLITKDRFIKILFPNKKASFLYKKIEQKYYDYLINLRNYIQFESRSR